MLREAIQRIEQQNQFEDAISILLYMAENDSLNESFEEMSEAQITEGVKDWLGKVGLTLHKGDGLIDYMMQFSKGAGKLIIAAMKGDKEEVKKIASTLDKGKVMDFLFKLDMATMHIVTGPIHLVDAVTGWDLMANLKQVAHGAKNALGDFFKAIEQVSTTIKNVVTGKRQQKLLKSVNVLKNSVPTT